MIFNNEMFLEGNVGYKINKLFGKIENFASALYRTWYKILDFWFESKNLIN